MKNIAFHSNCLDSESQKEWNKVCSYFIDSLDSLFVGIAELHKDNVLYIKRYIDIDLDYMKLLHEYSFPIKEYESTFQDRKSLITSVKYYLTCWLEGIPVLKIPQTMYKRMFKFMWTPHVLDIEENNRITFSPLMQIKRMKYILVDHVVYKIIDVEIRNYLRSWAIRFVFKVYPCLNNNLIYILLAILKYTT